jgi:two-component system CheB/CheR fusion protein
MGEVPSRSLEGIHVLIVDDDVAGRHFLRSVLELAGAIVTAASAADALRVALVADLIVCDLPSAKAAQPDFLPRLRHVHVRHGRRVPAIAMVPHGGMRSAPVLAPGFDRYLPKPVDREELRAAVRELLRR